MEQFINSLKARFKVEKSEIERLYFQYLFNTLKNYKSVSKPKCYIIGGQPGSGKTALHYKYSKLLKQNMVICNADDYRDFHPQADTIFKIYERFYPAITAEFSQPMNNLLINDCRKKKLNFSIETTFKDGDLVNNTILENKKYGYKTTIALISLNKKWSKLGVVERYEENRFLSNHSRQVSTASHDDRYEAIPKALEKVIASNLFDNLEIYKRNTELKSLNNSIQLKLLHTIPENALEIFCKERNRKFTVSEIHKYSNVFNRIVSLMRKRNVSSELIQKFKNDFRLYFD